MGLFKTKISAEDAIFKRVVESEKEGEEGEFSLGLGLELSPCAEAKVFEVAGVGELVGAKLGIDIG